MNTVASLPAKMDMHSPALITRYGEDYLDGWNSAVEAMQAALASPAPSAGVGVEDDEVSDVLAWLEQRRGTVMYDRTAALVRALQHPAAAPRVEETKCIHCGEPTMHVGNVCYACSHPGSENGVSILNNEGYGTTAYVATPAPTEDNATPAAPSVSPAVEGGLPEPCNHQWLTDGTGPTQCGRCGKLTDDPDRNPMPSKAERMARERVGAGRICVGSDLHLLEMLLAGLDEARRRLATPKQPGSAVQGEAPLSPNSGVWTSLVIILASGQLLKDKDPLMAADIIGHVQQIVDALEPLTTPPAAPAAEQANSCKCACHRNPDIKHAIPCCTQPEARGVEEIAKALWHRFGDDSRVEWEDEPEKAIYRDAAAQVIALATPNPVRAEQPEGKGATRFAGFTRFHLDNWTDDDFKQHIRAVREALAEALAAAPAAPGAAVGVDEAMVESAARAVEKATVGASYGWTDDQFEVWWNSPLFTEQRTSWGWFTGTRKEKRIAETRIALTAALAGKDGA